MLEHLDGGSALLKMVGAEEYRNLLFSRSLCSILTESTNFNLLQCYVGNVQTKVMVAVSLKHGLGEEQ